ncbi:hypothetical protein K7432_009918 [Basidiobolus ranarum]|uniref:Arrestin C-terminal-like domain-containing protein n=1 Tax=Basidiobolus ranarum TaxID=34480 RepID=A0ABR2VWA9_9FUNG
MRNLVNSIVSTFTTNFPNQSKNNDRHMLKNLFYVVRLKPCYLNPSSTEDAILPGKVIEVRLVNDVLTMYGRPGDSVGVVLRGTVLVNLRRPMKARSIKLMFKGTFTMDSPTDLMRRERTIIENHLCFLRTPEDTQILKASSYQFDFEMPLNGDLPPSIYTGAASIHYQVTAMIERPFLYRNIIAQCPVSIQRSIFPDTFEIDTPSTTFSGVWASCLYYDVSIPDLNFVIGEMIPLTFKLYIMAKALEIHYVHLVLEEKITYQDEEYLFPTSVNESIAWLKVRCPDIHDQCWEDTISMEIPSKAHEDCGPTFVEVSHKLIIRFAINLPDTGKNIIFGQIPIKLMSTAQAEASGSLPLYEPRQLPSLPPPFPSTSHQQEVNRDVLNFEHPPPPKYCTISVT